VVSLLVVDVGNTNTVLGMYEEKTLTADWRLATRRDATADEVGILLQGLLGPSRASVTRGIVATVVPSLHFPWKAAFRRYLGFEPLFVEPGIKTGMPILYDNPQEVGADRIVNAVAAFEKYGGPCIVVDFGTATTFDIVSEKGDYEGGVIAPGANLSAEALHGAAAMLPRVAVGRTQSVIGKDTVPAMQSGLYWGYVSLIEGLVARIKEEYGKPMSVIATGGLANLFYKQTSVIEHLDPDLTIRGLIQIHARNVKRAKVKPPSA
jgi:type III pantothenate kinase